MTSASAPASSPFFPGVLRFLTPMAPHRIALATALLQERAQNETPEIVAKITFEVIKNAEQSKRMQFTDEQKAKISSKIDKLTPTISNRVIRNFALKSVDYIPDSQVIPLLTLMQSSPEGCQQVIHTQANNINEFMSYVCNFPLDEPFQVHPTLSALSPENLESRKHLMKLILNGDHLNKEISLIMEEVLLSLFAILEATGAKVSPEIKLEIKASISEELKLHVETIMKSLYWKSFMRSISDDELSKFLSAFEKKAANQTLEDAEKELINKTELSLNGFYKKVQLAAASSPDIFDLFSLKCKKYSFEMDPYDRVSAFLSKEIIKETTKKYFFCGLKKFSVELSPNQIELIREKFLPQLRTTFFITHQQLCQNDIRGELLRKRSRAQVNEMCTLAASKKSLSKEDQLLLELMANNIPRNTNSYAFITYLFFQTFNPYIEEFSKYSKTNEIKTAEPLPLEAPSVAPEESALPTEKGQQPSIPFGSPSIFNV